MKNVKIHTHFLPPLSTGNRQTPENRTIQHSRHDDVDMHVCDDETWRFERIKADIEKGRYLDMQPVNLDAWKKAKEKQLKAKNAKKAKENAK